MERISANPQCSAAKLLGKFEQANRAKARDNVGLAGGYAHAATEFRKALHLHIAECGTCLALEDDDQERAA